MRTIKATTLLLALLLALLFAVLLAGCGGGQHSTSVSSTSTAAQPTKTGIASTRRPPPAAVKRARNSKAHPRPATGSQVRLPATFTIHPGDKLVPQTISSPAKVPILLTVRSADGAMHHVVVRTTRPRSFTVRPNSIAAITLGPLPAGRYVIDVDGSVAGSLLVGGEPGP